MVSERAAALAFWTKPDVSVNKFAALKTGLLIHSHIFDPPCSLLHFCISYSSDDYIIFSQGFGKESLRSYQPITNRGYWSVGLVCACTQNLYLSLYSKSSLKHSRLHKLYSVSHYWALKLALEIEKHILLVALQVWCDQ